jgi:hypothetical protein
MESGKVSLKYSAVKYHSLISLPKNIKTLIKWDI